MKRAWKPPGLGESFTPSRYRECDQAKGDTNTQIPGVCSMHGRERVPARPASLEATGAPVGAHLVLNPPCALRPLACSAASSCSSSLVALRMLRARWRPTTDSMPEPYARVRGRALMPPDTGPGRLLLAFSSLHEVSVPRTTCANSVLGSP